MREKPPAPVGWHGSCLVWGMSKIWKGVISFGLVSIPVSLRSATEEERVRFRMLDKRDHAPVGYKPYNKTTGREITRDQIIKGYEYEPHRFVEMTDKEIKSLVPETTQSLEIEDFINGDELDPMLLERPYYLIWEKGGEKGYALLRDVMERTEKVAIGKIVIHQRQHLAAILARGKYLVLETLRFSKEIVEIDEAAFLTPVKSKQKTKTTAPTQQEIKIAEMLVDEMTHPWDPEKYQETYQQDLMKHIRQKIRTGKTRKSPVEKTAASNTNVVDLMPLLKKSLKSSPKRKSA